jgi:hypothetical protein
MNGFAAVLGAAALVATVGTGGSLAPVGARQPSPRTQLTSCDPQFFAPPGDIEGACLDGDVIIVAADRAHAVALNALVLDVTDIAPIGRIKIGNGSIGPLNPSANTWVAVKVQVKNTSRRSATLRDEQFNLRVRGIRYQPAPEATSEIPNTLTKANRKIAKGATTRGTLVFEVPNPDLGLLTTSPAALLFTGFGGDFAFSTFPTHAIGSVRLYK